MLKELHIQYITREKIEKNKIEKNKRFKKNDLVTCACYC